MDIFVCLGHFSKYIVLKPTRNPSPEGEIKVLEQKVFYPSEVPSDDEFVVDDEQFVSMASRDFLRRYGVQHIELALFSPQANTALQIIHYNL